jgi:hypothetical protein
VAKEQSRIIKSQYTSRRDNFPVHNIADLIPDEHQEQTNSNNEKSLDTLDATENPQTKAPEVSSQ